jgi:signal transduction histidine kinase
MTARAGEPLEESLPGPKGSPAVRTTRFAATLRRYTVTGAAIAAIVVGVMATTTALDGQVYGGVGVDVSGTRVSEAFPGSFAWRDGIRPGQRILELHASDEAGGWEIITEGALGPTRSGASGHEERLRGQVVYGLSAIILAVAAAILSSTRGVVASVLVVAAFGLAVAPLRLAGTPLPSSIGTLAALGAPWLLLATRTASSWRIPAAVAVSSLLFVLGIAWLASRFALAEWFGRVDGAVVAVAVAGYVAVAIYVGALAWRTEMIRAPQASRVDAAAAGIAIAAGLVGYFYLRLPTEPMLALGIVLVIAYPRTRRFVADVADRLFVSDLREQLRIDAVEAERERIAREIHDAPLQDLTGVIHRLERRPDTVAEREALEAVAADLRASAMNVRPPMLDDLGLGPALEFLVDRENGQPSGFRVELDLDIETGYVRSERPPIEVELAVLRIAQEAMANAERHSRATGVVVSGFIRRDQIELSVSDDGVGIPSHLVGARGERLGLSSMRARAASIGAELSISRRVPSGTTVEVRWPR